MDNRDKLRKIFCNKFRTNVRKFEKKHYFCITETMPRWRNGRRARFRCECLTACRFESYPGHTPRRIIFGGVFLYQSSPLQHTGISRQSPICMLLQCTQTIHARQSDEPAAHRYPAYVRNDKRYHSEEQRSCDVGVSLSGMQRKEVCPPKREILTSDVPSYSE